MRDDFIDDTLSFTLQQAYDYFYSAKKAENMRNTTLITYKEHYKFFVEWLKITVFKIGN